MRFRIRKELIPWVLAGGRAALGPLLIAGAMCSWNGFALAGMVIAALLSDIYDGVLARRWHCDTEAVRLFDSMADTAFYLCTAAAIWIDQPQLWRDCPRLLIVLLTLEAVRFAFDFVKFGKPASYHSYLAKTWGLVMALAVIGVFALHRSNVLVPAALVLGVLCDLEGLSMSLILPVWRKDIKTLPAAWRLRKESTDSGGKLLPNYAKRNRLGRRPFLKKGRYVCGASLAILLSLSLTQQAVAVEAGQAEYRGGTLPFPKGTTGSLDSNSPTALVFRYAVASYTAAGSGSGETDIDYKNINGFEYHTEVAYHLGVLPAIAVGLVKRRERRHYFTIKFVDSSNVVQVAIFEVPKHDPPALLETLRARAPQASPLQQLHCIRNRCP